MINDNEDENLNDSDLEEILKELNAENDQMNSGESDDEKKDLFINDMLDYNIEEERVHIQIS